MRLYALLFTLLAACEPFPPEPKNPKVAGEDPNSGTMECHEETPTGSNISHKVCREKSNSQDSLNQDTVQRNLEKPSTAPPQRGN